MKHARSEGGAVLNSARKRLLGPAPEGRMLMLVSRAEAGSDHGAGRVGRTTSGNVS